MINDRIDGRVYGGRRGKTCDVKREYSIELHCSCKNGSRIEFLRSNIKIRKYILELTSNRKVWEKCLWLERQSDLGDSGVAKTSNFKIELAFYMRNDFILYFT